MKLYRSGGALVMAAALFAACDDTGTDPVVMADLAGSWEASSFRYTDAENSQITLDIITDAQGSLTLDITSTGAFTGLVIIPGVTPEGGYPVGGTLTLDADAGTIFVDFNAASEALFSDFTATFTLNEAGNILTWTNPDTSFDFPDSFDPRGEVAAVLVVVLEK
ncbi:MAG TPA: hypothetical protein VMM83_03855 [Longimicrobiales bacterium]|nr:hypothetical protein [Longimicrobiales bacterium]